MLLAIDIGNTNIVLGAFDGETLAQSWRLTTDRGRTADELGIMVTTLFHHAGIEPDAVDGVILASVVPPLTGVMQEMCTRYFGREPLVVEGTQDTGLPVRYEPPSDVGADRLVNAVAAFELYGRPRRAPVIVVDFGTATTFDAISVDGAYLGGAICPGIQISAEALFQRAARLPKVDVRRPASVIGRTTVASMQAGLYFGYVEMVDGLVRRLQHELTGESGRAAVCVATGGMAGVLARDTTVIDEVNPDLTLVGLRMIWSRRRS